MKRVESFVLQEIGGEAILVPTGQKVVDLNGLVTLNATGSFLWRQLATERTVDDLVQLLCAEFEVAPDTAHSDLAVFIDCLASLQAVEQ